MDLGDSVQLGTLVYPSGDSACATPNDYGGGSTILKCNTTAGSTAWCSNDAVTAATAPW